MPSVAFLQEYAAAVGFLGRRDSEAAQRSADSLLAVAKEGQDDGETGLALLLRSYCSTATGDTDTAYTALKQSAELLERAALWEHFGEAVLLLGAAEKGRGRYDESISLWLDAVEKLLSKRRGASILPELLGELAPLFRRFSPEPDARVVWCRQVIRLCKAYLMISRPDECLQLVERALREPLERSQLFEIKNLGGAAAAMLGMPKDAANLLRDAYELVLQSGEQPSSYLDLLHNLGKAYNETGEHQKAISALGIANAAARAAGAPRWFETSNLIELGATHRNGGDSTAARRYLLKALTLSATLPFNTDVNSAVIRASALTNYGLVEMDNGNDVAAAEFHTEALRVLDQASVSSPHVKAQAEANLGLALENAGQAAQSRTHWQNALESYRSIGNTPREVAALHALGRVCVALGDTTQGITYFTAAASTAQAIGASQEQGRALFQLADIHIASNKFLEATVCLAAASQCFSRCGDVHRAALSHKLHGLILGRLHNWSEAQRFLSLAADLFSKIGNHQELLDCRSKLAVVHFNRGLIMEALETLDSVWSDSRDGHIADAASHATKMVFRVYSRLFDLAIRKREFAPAANILQVMKARAETFQFSLDTYVIASALFRTAYEIDQSGKTNSASSTPRRLAQLLPRKHSKVSPSTEQFPEELQASLKRRRCGATIPHDGASFEVKQAFLSSIRSALLELSEETEVDEADSLTAEAKHTSELWQVGLSSGLPRSQRRIYELNPKSSHLSGVTADNPCARDLSGLVDAYHALAAWEDPNLALVVPILDTYCRRTRFRAKYCINPLALSGHTLNVFFFRSDPLGRLARFLDTCSYIDSGNVILCSLPFLETLSKYYQSSAKAIQSATWFAVGQAPSWFNDGVPAELAEQLAQRVSSMASNSLVEWVIAHEVGHAHLMHRSVSLDGGHVGREQESMADQFFVEGIPDETAATRLWVVLTPVLTAVFRELYEAEYGRSYSGPGSITEEVQVHVRDVGPHGPFVIRLLDVLDQIVARFPGVDRTQYFGRVRQNVVLTEDPR